MTNKEHRRVVWCIWTLIVFVVSFTFGYNTAPKDVIKNTRTINEIRLEYINTCVGNMRRHTVYPNYKEFYTQCNAAANTLSLKE